MNQIEDRNQVFAGVPILGGDGRGGGEYLPIIWLRMQN